MTFRKKLTIFLVLAFFLSVFSGGFYHCCDYYSHACSICVHGGPHPDLSPAPAIAADDIRPLAAVSHLVLSAEKIPNPSLWHAPLSGRAPPSVS
jgi:hypothetical protein